MISMMISVVLPPPRRPAVTKNAGRSGSSDRSITVSRRRDDDALAVDRCNVHQPLVAEELHRLRAPRHACSALRCGSNSRSSWAIMKMIPRSRSSPSGASSAPSASTIGTVAIATTVGSTPSSRLLIVLARTSVPQVHGATAARVVLLEEIDVPFDHLGDLHPFIRTSAHCSGGGRLSCIRVLLWFRVGIFAVEGVGVGNRGLARLRHKPRRCRAPAAPARGRRR